MERRILGIDVGLCNLALVSVAVSPDHEIGSVRRSTVVDVTRVRCLPGCVLHHSNNVVDRMNHMFASYADWFDEADEILVEAQPPVGLVHVEALILSRFRHKTSLVQPVAVQAHFKWPQCDYEAKKQAAVDTAGPYMPSLGDLRRKHDAADAFCLVLYTCQVRRRTDAARRWLEQRRGQGVEGMKNPFTRFVCLRASLQTPGTPTAPSS